MPSTRSPASGVTPRVEAARTLQSRRRTARNRHHLSRYKEESVLVEEARTVFPDTHPATEGTTFTIENGSNHEGAEIQLVRSGWPTNAAAPNTGCSVAGKDTSNT